VHADADVVARVEELKTPGLIVFVLEPEGVRVLCDPALAPGDVDIVRVPDVWDFKKDEKKPRKPSSVQKRKRKGKA
jgi:hypothetical protein